jgi:hypothetical protein
MWLKRTIICNTIYSIWLFLRLWNITEISSFWLYKFYNRTIFFQSFKFSINLITIHIILGKSRKIFIHLINFEIITLVELINVILFNFFIGIILFFLYSFFFFFLCFLCWFLILLLFIFFTWLTSILW